MDAILPYLCGICHILTIFFPLPFAIKLPCEIWTEIMIFLGPIHCRTHSITNRWFNQLIEARLAKFWWTDKQMVNKIPRFMTIWRTQISISKLPNESWHQKIDSTRNQLKHLKNSLVNKLIDFSRNFWKSI